LKKAHAKELAAHVQESNKKYNDLLMEKLSSEEALKAEFAVEKTALTKHWQGKCEETALAARAQEQATAKAKLAATILDYNGRIDQLEQTIKELKESVQEHRQVIQSKDEVIGQKNTVIQNNEDKIHNLQEEVKRLQDMLA